MVVAAVMLKTTMEGAAFDWVVVVAAVVLKTTTEGAA